MSASLLPVIAVILVSGLAVQLLAHRLKVPSVIFYLLIGFVLGPEVLGLVTLDTFGNGLEIVVGISVAIIVFEGAFALRIERVRGASTVSFRLVTVSALVMFLGTAAAVRFFEGASWEIALLIGALLVATGPTVITPILDVVRGRDHVATALETEGIVNDVTAAIVAVVIFETLLLDDLGVPATVLSFLQRLGVGVAAGVLATVTIYIILDSDLVPERDIQASQFLVLAAAVGAFAAAEVVAAEAFPEAEKPRLLKLRLDFGDETRQSAAQLGYHHTPEELPGMQVLCATNLGSIRIAGFNSEVLTVGVFPA